MTALKIVVACVSLATFGLLVAIPYKMNETAGHLCAAVGVIGALGALSAGYRKAMDGAWRWVERLFRRAHNGVALTLLLTLPAWLRFFLPEDTAMPVILAYCGVLWGLGTAWLGYKVVQTLRGPPHAA